MASYFFYGTLMDAAVRQTVCGRKPVRTAYLTGFQRYYVPHASYPVLVADPGHVLDGLYVTGVDAKSVRRLDLFEGPEYEVVEVPINLDSPLGKEAMARVYMPRPGTLATPYVWDYERWKCADRSAYLARIRRWAGGSARQMFG
ncbi:MAG: gamma-glutamylcyclotransferase family protein [Rhodospirillales bacterium]